MTILPRQYFHSHLAREDKWHGQVTQQAREEWGYAPRPQPDAETVRTCLLSHRNAKGAKHRPVYIRHVRRLAPLSRQWGKRGSLVPCDALLSPLSESWLKERPDRALELGTDAQRPIGEYCPSHKHHLLIHEHGMSFYLVNFFNFFQQCFVILRAWSFVSVNFIPKYFILLDVRVNEVFFILFSVAHCHYIVIQLIYVYWPYILQSCWNFYNFLVDFLRFSIYKSMLSISRNTFFPICMHIISISWLVALTMYNAEQKW